MALNIMRAASGSTATCSSREASTPSVPCRQQQLNIRSPKCAAQRKSVAARAAPAERVSPVEPLAPTPWHQLDKKHVLHANQFNKESLDMMFEEAIKMEKHRAHERECYRRLRLSGSCVVGNRSLLTGTLLELATEACIMIMHIGLPQLSTHTRAPSKRVLTMPPLLLTAYRHNPDCRRLCRLHRAAALP
eukprot:scaffold104609_cov18-Tisochrysis_lutea.AAC.1